ncbi:sugar phosphate isomerase/epimerase family protein [Pleomorphovibrio marinus]|uniref:sugar phosphate isomerase/epimerase family protein n=1 Tax=Pleomorphovibrio marinus TaxID=2164132 RepID=UPI000E0C8CCF|nr:sugar phosphate isomerase/epimerase [Pleomorphovibrio marinus]
MKLGIFARTYHTQDLEQLFSSISKDGLSVVHFNMSCAGLDALPETVPEGFPEYIKGLAEMFRVELGGISATYNMIHPDPAIRHAGARSLQELAAAASSMQVKLVSLCTGSRDPDKWKWHPENSSKASWKQLLLSMEEAIRVTETFGTLLGIEPEQENIVKTPALAKKLLTELQEPRLRIILDPANLFQTASSREAVTRAMDSAMDLLKGHIAMAHAKDRTLEGKVVRPGKGAVDFGWFLQSLVRTGFQGPLIMHGLDEAEVPEASDFLLDLINDGKNRGY